MLFYENHTEDYTILPESNFPFIPHAHHNMELLVCVSGTYSVSCRGQERVLRPGDLMIAFSHDIHAYLGGGEGEGVMMIVNPDILPLLSGHLRERRYENFLVGGNFDGLALEILKEYQGQRSREILVGYLYVLLGKLLRELPSREERDAVSTDTFSQAMEYLSMHYTQSVSLKELAHRFGVDSCHLSRMFTERLGFGYLKYLHILRVAHARELLRRTDLKMAEIWSSSGFGDQKTFNRVFREITGMTPSAYRREYG